MFEKNNKAHKVGSDDAPSREFLQDQWKNRTLAGGPALLVFITSIAAAIFHIFALGIQSPGVMNLRMLHLLLAFILVPLLYSGWKSSSEKVHWSDYVLILAGIFSTFYIFIEGDDIIWRYGVSPTILDLFFGSITILLILEITRRTMGWPLVIVVLSMMIYALFGSYFPGILQTSSFPIERMISFLYSMDGIYGIPIGVSSTYVYLFVLFGALLRLSRTGDFYMDLAYSIAGRMRGGPGQVSVISSALFGTMSGSGIANVVTTGTLTIPLMIRAGFSRVFAASVESVASTGGQFMPPVMGAGAFLMAEYARVPYPSIVVAATLPAFLFFLSVMLIVDIEAAKENLKGLKAEDLPRFLTVLRQWGHLSIPVLVLIYMLVIERSSPIRAALFAMGTTYFVSWLRVESRLSFKRLGEAAVEGSKGSLEVITACASAGLIMGLFSLTGISNHISSMVVSLSGGVMLFGLILTALVTIILSMGLPATAAYIISASMIAGALHEMGAPTLAAHLFIFYFACLSGITPPVALVAFPAGSIAGANPFSVGIRSFKLAIPAFIIPFMFVYAPPLLMQGSINDVLLSTLSAIVGIWALASALGGWLLGRTLSGFLRVPLVGGALAMIFSGIKSDIAGLIIIIIITLIQWLTRNKLKSSS